MKKLYFLQLIIISFHCFAQQEAVIKSSSQKVLLNANVIRKYQSDTALNGSKIRLEIPNLQANEYIIDHTGYSLVFNEKYKQAKWVAYELTASETEKVAERSNAFKPDSTIPKLTNQARDYTGSGYDRGHLAPAADQSWSLQAMQESFYYSNMSPQLPGFNRGIWKNLEEQVRQWARDNEVIYIVTGPVLKDNLSTLGESSIAIPKYYYKVILDYKEPELKGIGFIMPNESSSYPLQHFAVSIDSVENLTGIDFFPLLPDVDETTLEKNVCISCWNWGQNKNYKLLSNARENKSEPSGQIKPQAVQCSAITKAGTRCKRMTSTADGKCYQHNGK
ncbi:MAG TPA: DNA/RNA non-specific endonuclease [Pelobium sp.]|nr:DNA/RNA non-specific endonuclease [Pelobium sp.]